MTQLIVKAQLPGNAHLDIPEDTPVIIMSRHTTSRRGVKNALQSRKRTLREYRKAYGNAAASRCWIEQGTTWLDPWVLQCMVDSSIPWTHKYFDKEYAFILQEAST